MKIEWNKVTWYSKLLAVILFLVVLALGFYIGALYEMVKVQNDALSTSIQNTSQIVSATFTCDAGKSLQAVFYDDKATVSLSDGRIMNLPRTISADGGRYANTDDSFVFWNKGNTAFIMENGTTTFSNCVTSQS